MGALQSRRHPSDPVPGPRASIFDDGQRRPNKPSHTGVLMGTVFLQSVEPVYFLQPRSHPTLPASKPCSGSPDLLLLLCVSFPNVLMDCPAPQAFFFFF